MITEEQLAESRAATIRRARAAVASLAYDIPDDEEILTICREAIAEVRAARRAATEQATALIASDRARRAARTPDPNSPIGRLLAML